MLITLPSSLAVGGIDNQVRAAGSSPDLHREPVVHVVAEHLARPSRAPRGLMWVSGTRDWGPAQGALLVHALPDTHVQPTSSL
jgi:hypothetical protein